MPPASLLTAATLLAANRALTALHLRPRIDGWRRATGLLLRDEASTFILSTFALNIWSDTQPPTNPSITQSEQHLALRLRAFLTSEPLAHTHIRTSPDEHFAEPHTAPSYTLAFEPRPPSPARFIAPSTWPGDHHPSAPPAPSTNPLFNIVARIGPDHTADLWFRINHVGTDGQPAQELITRLEQSWGTDPALTYPTPEEFAPHAVARPSASRGGRDDLGELHMFLDFAPILEWRKRINATLPDPIPITAAILWRLAQHPDFADLHYGTTVEVPMIADINRGVGVIVVRPADHKRHANPIAHYAARFNRELAATRNRATSGAKTLDAAAHLPPRLATQLLTHALDNTPAAFGTMALTMLKDAKVFGAPIARHGHPDGFLAIGSVNLPTNDHRKVGSLTIKGPLKAIADYPAKITHALCRTGD